MMSFEDSCQYSAESIKCNKARALIRVGAHTTLLVSKANMYFYEKDAFVHQKYPVV